MEQGPDDLSDRADERADQLEDRTNTPLDRQRAADAGDDDSDDSDDEDLQRIDPGL